MSNEPSIHTNGDSIYFSFTGNPPVGFHILVDHMGIGAPTLDQYCDQWNLANKNRFVEARDGVLKAENVLKQIDIGGFYRFDPTPTRLPG